MNLENVCSAYRYFKSVGLKVKLETHALIEQACKSEIEWWNLKEMQEMEMNEWLVRLPFKIKIQDIKDLSKAIDEWTWKDIEELEEEDLKALKEEFPDYWEDIE